ncbi:MAG TPA: ATP-binding protein [Polyangia bacterium]|nr:ATP-binding protein [Polyangia bacterium]
MSAAQPEEPPPPSPAARRRARELEARTLIEIAHTLDSSVDECQRLTRSLTLLKTLLRCDRCSILFDEGDGSRKMLSVPIVTGDDVMRLEDRLLGLLRALGDNGAVPHESHGNALALPLVGLDEVRGIVAVERTSDHFTADEMRLLSVVTAQLGAYLTMLGMNRELVALDRYKREMSALAAHDIKGPLGAVIGMVDFLSLELNQAPDYVRNCLNDIRTACNRIHRVTANLLDLARLESKQLPLQLVSLDVAALLTTLARHRTAQASFRDIRILVRPAPPGPRARADEDLLSRVIDNLLDNALRYAPVHGRIEMEARWTGERVYVLVGNNGPPVAPVARGTIFEKFARGAEGNRMNLGLGLYFARVAMEAQGGRIWLEETAELPTVFGLELPAAATS